MNYGSPTPITAAGQLQRFVVRLTLIANIAEDFPCFVFAKEIGHVGGSRHSCLLNITTITNADWQHICSLVQSHLQLSMSSNMLDMN